MNKHDNKYDVIIIGSGFGGSVSALRMAEKGYRVLVIEKGKQYRTQDFPKSNWNLRKYLWLPSFFLYGIQKLTLLKDVLVLSGTGVGGGSLVYANTHLEPPDNVFKQSDWTDGNWHDRLKPFYRLARKMLGTTPVKTTGESDHLL
ncbi:MAG: FAD-binding protein, partial [Fidelibacterota bacterium]